MNFEREFESIVTMVGFVSANELVLPVNEDVEEGLGWVLEASRVGLMDDVCDTVGIERRVCDGGIVRDRVFGTVKLEAVAAVTDSVLTVIVTSLDGDTGLVREYWERVIDVVAEDKKDAAVFEASLVGDTILAVRGAVVDTA